ncbi:MAG: Verru_Chthon cassette protein A [Chthoniobacteraceae bacterium]
MRVITKNRTRSSGVALVLVLAFLVLITVFIIAFFSSVTTERASSKNYANMVTTKQLADSAVNLVMAQIVDATTGTNSVSRLAWASQPGMIRTYDVTGTDAGFYKLYSSKNMVTNQAQLANELNPSNTAAEISANWYSMPALYTDLNSPVLVPDQNGQIVPDSTAPGDTYIASYPILNPVAQAPNPDLPSNGQAEGFSISGTNVGYTGGNPPASGYNPAQAAVNNTPNPAAMPVQWLYVLRDGTVTAPDGSSGGGGIATWSGTNGSCPPSAGNPIVGRVAFWTDDDTSKININTAGGDQQYRTSGSNSDGQNFLGQPASASGGSATPGAFWDIPRTESPEDQSLAQSQLVQQEFQRYPGHPATVALSLLFPNLNRDQILALTPRFSGTNSSEGGTIVTTSTTAGTPSVVPVAFNRLYASTDELEFQPGTSGSNRPLNTSGTTGVSNSVVDQYRFFLTAHSRAPETNLFNLPRITIWPITTQSGAQQPSTQYQTASDSLIAFCSTTGTNPYYFTRYDSNSMTNDYANITRNQQLYAYLQWLTGQQIPGVANTVLGTSCPARGFLDKYPSGGSGAPERDQILTEIFDYIRSSVNLQDSELVASGGIPYTPSAAVGGTSGNMMPGSGQVTPIRIGTTQGFGRFPTIAEAAIVWISTTPYSTLTPNPGPYSMQANLLFETYNVAQGFATYRPSLQHVVAVKQPFTVTVGGTTTTLDFTGGTNVINGIAGDYSESWGGVEGILSPLFASITYPPPLKSALNYGTIKTVPANRSGTTPNQYPFFSSAMPLPTPPVSPPLTFDFGGGEITVAVQTTDGQTVQNIDLYFPPATNILAPMPVPPGVNISANYRDGNLTWQGRFNSVQGINSGAANSLLLSGTYSGSGPTTIRALEPAGINVQGDYRIIAASPNISGTAYFLPHYNYFDGGNNQFAHSLRFAYQGQTFGGASYGSLVANGAYSTGTPITVPDFPSSVGHFAGSSTNAVIMTSSGSLIPGDWDNGIADSCDGAYINKADEGTILNGQSTVVSGSVGAGNFAGSEYATVPYYAGGQLLSTTFHSPNRQIASAVMFGSLSTGVLRGLPWQTLLFHPDPYGGHPGNAQPKDYYLLDLFNMPVVEPYAISEPFSTAGKINLNYQILPFTYIKRTTALRAVLDSTMTMAIPTTAGSRYKAQGAALNANAPKMHFRHPIDPDATLQQFDARFANNDIFRSAAEICGIELIPKADGLLISGSLTASQMPAFWLANQLTGNNTRDMPYNHIYPLLTTKSNTYTVHFRVQSLQKPMNDPNPAQWNEGMGKITGEYRGSTTIERYIDASDLKLPDFATNQAATMDAYYKFKVVSTTKFAP